MTSQTMDCQTMQERLTARLSGALTPSELRELESHLAACATCAASRVIAGAAGFGVSCVNAAATMHASASVISVHPPGASRARRGSLRRRRGILHDAIEVRRGRDR